MKWRVIEGGVSEKRKDNAVGDGGTEVDADLVASLRGALSDLWELTNDPSSIKYVSIVVHQSGGVGINSWLFDEGSRFHLMGTLKYAAHKVAMDVYVDYELPDEDATD